MSTLFRALNPLAVRYDPDEGEGYAGGYGMDAGIGVDTYGGYSGVGTTPGAAEGDVSGSMDVGIGLGLEPGEIAAGGSTGPGTESSTLSRVLDVLSRIPGFGTIADVLSNIDQYGLVGGLAASIANGIVNVVATAGWSAANPAIGLGLAIANNLGLTDFVLDQLNELGVPTEFTTALRALVDTPGFVEDVIAKAQEAGIEVSMEDIAALGAPQEQGESGGPDAGTGQAPVEQQQAQTEEYPEAAPADAAAFAAAPAADTGGFIAQAQEFLAQNLGPWADAQTEDGRKLRALVQQMIGIAQPVQPLKVGPYQILPKARIALQQARLSALQQPAGILQQLESEAQARNLRRQELALGLLGEMAGTQMRGNYMLEGERTRGEYGLQQQELANEAAKYGAETQKEIAEMQEPSDWEKWLGAAPGIIEAGTGLLDILGGIFGGNDKKTGTVSGSLSFW